EGELVETRHLYYSDQWQVLEERIEDEDTAERQFVWGMRYVDDLVLRDRDTNADGSLDERLYALQDPNWNVAAVTNSTGDVQERYVYDAYGAPLVRSSSFGSRATSNYEWE